MDSQLLCLRWNNHQNNLVNVFEQLLQNEAFTDVTIAVEGKTIKCHQMVMAAASPYFQTIFMEHPCPHPVVFLKDITYGQVRSLLEYIYYGEASVHETDLQALLRVADTLKIKGLVEVEEETVAKKRRDSQSESRSRYSPSPPRSKSSSIWTASPSKLMGQHREEDNELVIDEGSTESNQISVDSMEVKPEFGNYSDDTPPAPGMIRVVGANGKAEWKRYKQYTKDDIVAAIEEVKSGMSALQASRKYGVPSRTLYDKVKKMGILTANMQKQIHQKKVPAHQSPSINLLGFQLPQANLPNGEHGTGKYHNGLNDSATDSDRTDALENFAGSSGRPPITGSIMMSMMSMMSEKLQANALLNRQSTPVSLASLLRHTGSSGVALSREGSDSGHSSSDLGDGVSGIKEELVEEEQKEPTELTPAHILSRLVHFNREELLSASVGGVVPGSATPPMNGAHAVTLSPRGEGASPPRKRKLSSSEGEDESEGSPQESQVLDCKKSNIEPLS